MEHLPMSSYEQERLENIRQNQNLLASLNIAPLVGEGNRTQKRSTSARPAVKRPAPVEPSERRLSNRLKGLAPTGEPLPDKPERTSLSSSGVYLGEDIWLPRKEGPVGFSWINQVPPSQGTEFLKKLDLVDTKNSPSTPSLLSSEFSSDRYYEKMATLSLTESTIRKITPARIYAIAFLPSSDKLIVCAGDRFGRLGFIDFDTEDADESSHIFQPHMGAISSVVYVNSSTLLTSSYDGTVRQMNLEKQVFDEIYVHPDEAMLTGIATPSFSQQQSLLYVSDKRGSVSRIDLRENSSSTNHQIFSLHEKRINSIQCHPIHSHVLITASGDRRACLWDTRMLKPDVEDNQPLVAFSHPQSISSASVSPSGNTLVTCCNDNQLYLYTMNSQTLQSQQPPETSRSPSRKRAEAALSVVKQEKISDQESLLRSFSDATSTTRTIHHNNYTGRWLTPFKAIFDPKHDDAIFVGNMKRAVDIFSSKTAAYAACLQHEHLGTIPAVNAVHPYHAMIISGNASGRCYLWK